MEMNMKGRTRYQVSRLVKKDFTYAKMNTMKTDFTKILTSIILQYVNQI